MPDIVGITCTDISTINYGELWGILWVYLHMCIHRLVNQQVMERWRQLGFNGLISGEHLHRKRLELRFPQLMISANSDVSGDGNTQYSSDSYRGIFSFPATRWESTLEMGMGRSFQMGIMPKGCGQCSIIFRRFQITTLHVLCLLWHDRR